MLTKDVTGVDLNQYTRMMWRERLRYLAPHVHTSVEEEQLRQWPGRRWTESFLVTLAEPLGLIMAVPLKSTSTMELGTSDYVLRCTAGFYSTKGQDPGARDRYRRCWRPPWEVPDFMIKDLVSHAVTLMNMKRNTSSGNTVAARVAFTGRKPLISLILLKAAPIPVLR